MEQKLRKYVRPLIKDGVHRYMGPQIYKGTLTDGTYQTICDMVSKSQESVKDLLCHTTTRNDRLEFEPNPLHYAALYEITTHIKNFTRGHNPQDWRDEEDFQLTNMWVNVQHANQHIGHHTHEEADYAFVIYVKNTLEDPTVEHDYQDRSVNDPVDGMIEWRYGEVHHLSPNRMLHFPKEKEIVVFPGWLEHQVYPFKDKSAERVSVAGNINIVST